MWLNRRLLHRDVRTIGPFGDARKTHPTKSDRPAAAGSPARVSRRAPAIGRGIWVAALVGIGLEFASGVACVVLGSRPGGPTGGFPRRAETSMLRMPCWGDCSASASCSSSSMPYVTNASSSSERPSDWLVSFWGLEGGCLRPFILGDLRVLHSMFAGSLVVFFGFLVGLAQQMPREAAGDNDRSS